MAAASGDESENSDVKIHEEVSDDAGESGKVDLCDLKVSELRVQLEKRDLDKSGNKAVLVERLKRALREEGSDADDVFKAPVSVDQKQSMTKKEANAKANGNLDSQSESEEDVLDKKETESSSDDKNTAEVTLQISIDEEDAQLNDDDNLDLKCSDVETQNKSNVKNSNSNTGNTDNSAKLKSDYEESPVKPSKSSVEESKDKKTPKAPQPSKSTALCSAVSSKVLKVIGKNDKVKNASILAKSLWVTGLPNTTRAADLKALFSKYGKVLSVRIVKSTKQTPGKCYGFVTMAASKDATKAIENLHQTEMNGRIISVEKTQNEPSILLKKTESKVVVANNKQPSTKKEVTKEVKLIPKQSPSESKTSQSLLRSKSESKPGVKSSESRNSAKVKDGKPKSVEHSKSKDREKDQKSRNHREREDRRQINRRPAPPLRSRPTFSDRSRFVPAFRKPFNSRFPSARPSFGMSTVRPRSDLSLYERMRQDRIRRERIREREQREADKQRALEISRHRYIERKQREEADRLEREKLKLRLEREMLEREKAEMLRMEREKQRLERERLERERELLRRQAELRRAPKRPFERMSREPDNFWNDRRKIPRFEERSTFRGIATTSRSEFLPRERSFPVRPSPSASVLRHSPRMTSSRIMASTPRSDFGDRDSRREVTIRAKEERQVYQRQDFRDRDSRRSFPVPKERQRLPARSEPSREDWRHERRVHERVVNPSSSGHRRVNYY